MVYNAYTSKDVKHLIEYLAENNRDGKGRCGNKIYQQLVENGISQQKKWPWSKNHPWQSWRDHYVKNEAILSKKIKMYQREHGILTEAQDSKNKDKKAMKIEAAETRRRLAQEEEEESSSSVAKESVYSRKRAGETVRDPSPSDRKRQKVMKESEERHSSLPKEGSNTSLAGHALAENEGKAEPTLPDIEDTEDRQEVNQMLAPDEQTGSAGASDKVLARRAVPSTTRRVSALARKVPVPSQSDDSFDSLFDADSDILVPDSDEVVNALLPGRAQNRDQRRDDFFQSSSGASTSTESVDKRRFLPRRRHPPVLVEGPFKTTFTTKASQPRGIGPDADLESDEVTGPWPPIRTQPRTPSSLKDQKSKRGQVKYNGSDEQAVMHHATGVDADHWHKNNRSHTASDTGLVHTSQHQLFKGVKSEPSPTVENGEHPISLLSKSRATRSAESRIPMVEEICDDFGFGNDQDSTSTRVDHPEQGTSRGSAMSQASQNGRYVDLHEEGRRRHSRRLTDVPGSSRGTSIFSTSHGRQSPIPIQLSTQDQSLVTTLGIQQAVTMMSKNHGFTEDVVSRILQNVSSIPRADEILREMRVKAEEAALNHLMLDEPRGRRSSKQPSRASRRFQIRAMSDDEMSDYSPPSKTRAGQFSRLVGQGRHEEAYAREARRASGVGHSSNNPNGENNTRSPSNKPGSRAESKANNTRSPSNKPGSRAEPKAVEDGVFFDSCVQEFGAEAVEDTVEDIADIRDAHAAMAPAFEQHESKLSPHRALQRFQQTAKIVKQILIDHQGHS
ncbi:hypothetical protein M378DRAFT_8528 [Amanita muscaria Koide BX008]|uniref:TERF2-interacting telomeric protein 1 Myb domain-containing protein n=1 Tax=Amanita muscaria (strain Koide BX008) TaxID=946122 RepID=A0A0C2SY64_AMAMK|nr:hypothetical protein M378DRAFT_8528 [Amanita muscaria Koide BX008]